MKAPQSRMKDRRGVALIMVVWLLLALSILTVHLCRSARLDIQSLEWHGSEIDAANLARSALLDAVSELGKMESETLSGSYIVRDENGEETGSYSYEIMDESGRLYFNEADIEEMSSLLRQLEFSGAQTTAAKLIAARDRYPGGGPLLASELPASDSISRELFYGEDENDNLVLEDNENDGIDTDPPDNGDGKLDFGLRRHIRVSCPGAVNINRATREVLSAVLNVSSEEANAIKALVEQSGGNATLPAMKNLSSLSETINDVNINDKVTDRSACFRISARGTQGSAVRSIHAYYRLDGDGAITLLNWWES